MSGSAKVTGGLQRASGVPALRGGVSAGQVDRIAERCRPAYDHNAEDRTDNLKHDDPPHSCIRLANMVGLRSEAVDTVNRVGTLGKTHYFVPLSSQPEFPVRNSRYRNALKSRLRRCRGWRPVVDSRPSAQGPSLAFLAILTIFTRCSHGVDCRRRSQGFLFSSRVQRPSRTFLSRNTLLGGNVHPYD
jgi:hypothetical protein